MSDFASSGLQIMEGYGCGDSYLLLNVLPPELAEKAFEGVRDATAWQDMFHLGGKVPRLVAVECDVRTKAEKGGLASIAPVYRHPVDAEPPSRNFTRITSDIRRHAEAGVRTVLELQMRRRQEKGGEEISGVPSHPLNHGLVQWYRGGGDFISDHSDKTLDVASGSCICNVSLGATRTLVLKNKRSHGSGHEAAEGSSKVFQKVRMPHNSMFVLGWRSNSNFTHGIKADKRVDSLKAADERLQDGQRISLTFRHIATFEKTQHDTEGGARVGLFGQGSIFKTEDALDRHWEGAGVGEKRVHVPSEEEQMLELVAAFGAENRLCGPPLPEEEVALEAGAAMTGAGAAPDEAGAAAAGPALQQQQFFDWHQHYGRGFTICNLHGAK